MQRLREADPERIGPYTLIARLGQGGMGTVFLGSRGVDRVAIKVVRSSYLDDPSLRTRFEREIATLQKVQSPHVAKFLDSAVEEDIAWHAVEFVNGPSLKEYVDEKGPLSESEWLAFATNLQQALADIHSLGIIHRDIKPSNIVMSEFGPKLIDFGIAMDSDQTSVTTTGMVAGSPAWLAPEQLLGDEVGPEADLFSAGSVLTFAATGRSPWGAETTLTIPTLHNRILNMKTDLSGLSDTQRLVIDGLLQEAPLSRRFLIDGDVIWPPIDDEGTGRKEEGGDDGDGTGQDARKKNPGLAVFVGILVAGLLIGLPAAWFVANNPSDEGSVTTAAESSSQSDESVDVGPLPRANTPLELRLGSLTPLSGFLAFIAPAQQAAVLAAVEDINEAQSPLSVTVEFGDEGDINNEEYLTEVPRLLESGVTAIVGPVASSVTAQVVDTISGPDGAVLVSPSASSSALTGYPDQGRFFRTIADDYIQGRALGDLMAADGHSRVALVLLEDDYGQVVGTEAQAAFEAGGGEVVSIVTARIGQTNFTYEVSLALAENPDAIAIVAFEETEGVLQLLAEEGFPGSRIYLTDGNTMYYDLLPYGALERAAGLIPGLNQPPDDLKQAMEEVWTGAGNRSLYQDDYWYYSAEAYDATILLALAALRAESIAPDAIAEYMIEVSSGQPNAQACYTFATCANILVDGGRINYEGLTGSIELDEQGDPLVAPISLYRFRAENFYEFERTLIGQWKSLE